MFVKTARRNFPENAPCGPKTFCTGYKTKLFDRTWSNIDKPESKSKVPAQPSPKSNNKYHLAPQGLRVHAEKLWGHPDIWRWCADAVVSIILWNSFCKAAYALNGHLPRQDCPYPPSLVLDPWMIEGILTSGDGVQMSVSLFGTTFVKQSLPEMVIFMVKTAPIIHLWWWILGG